MAQQDLQTFTSLIEIPYISVSFGGQTFGLTEKINPITKTRDINYVSSLSVQKLASGTVNKYTLKLDYVITPGSDPNFIDKVISSDMSRQITFTYGDLSQPSFSYKQEKAIITSIKPNIDVVSPKLSYTIQATSSVALSYSIKRNYPSKKAKPSDLIFDLLYVDKSNGLLELFVGMADRREVELNGWIARNDKVVSIDPKQGISPLEYLKFLVSQMISTSNSFYAMVIHDTIDVINGPWFEVINSNLRPEKYYLEVDVGYPGSIPVFNFNVSENTSFALITEYQKKVDENRSININSFGEETVTGDPSFVINRGSVDPVLQAWWKSMTSFPISATLNTRGLVVPAILCETIKVNVLFFGRKYNYSGNYMVISQTDEISLSGYRTNLNLIRIGGE